jgi:hypothetical protein
MWYTRIIYKKKFINRTLRMSDNLPERVQILCHVHIICITVLENRIICCQIFIFCNLLLKSAFEWIFDVMQLIFVKIKWHIKWKYWIQKFHDIGLSYYFNIFFRWIKFEEDVEEGGERWSKPHVATLSLHSLFELRCGLLNGTVMLDCDAISIQYVFGKIKIY